MHDTTTPPWASLIAAIMVAVVLTGCSKKDFPPSAYETGHIDFGAAYDLFVQGDYAYVTHNDGMSIVHIADKIRPVEVAMVKTNESALGILVENEIAYLGSGGNENLKIIDVSDKDHPEVISKLTISGPVYGIVKNSNTLFLSTWNGYLFVVDISDLQIPFIISELNCQGNGSDLVYVDQMIYYANAQKGMQRIDVTDLESPVLRSTVPSTSGAWDMYAHGGSLFLGRNRMGFSSFEIKADKTLAQRFTRDNGGEVYGISQEGNTLYVADLVNGLELWDISNPTQPFLVTTVEEYSPHDIAVVNGIIYLADQDRSFVILDIQ
jgi:hypothetical protein